MDTPDDGPRFVRADLFAFLRAVAIAPDLDAAALRTLVLLALTGDGTSGANVTVDAPGLASARGITERTVWRHLEQVRGTWLDQTTAPTRGGRGGPGRRARYHLCIPESSDTGTLSADTRRPEPSDIPPQADVTRNPESSDVPRGAMSDENENHLTSEAESSDIAERKSAARPTSDGPTPPPSPRRADRRPVIVEWLMGEGEIPEATARRVVELAEADPTTTASASGRLRGADDYRRRLTAQAQAEDRARAADARRCAHGTVNGQTIRGAGANASRVCGGCEHESPADRVPPPTHLHQVRRTETPGQGSHSMPQTPAPDPWSLPAPRLAAGSR